jgi:hypothetical protein
MSNNSIPVADDKTSIPPIANGSPSAEETSLSPGKKAALISRAKDVIAGRIPPPALIVPPEVERFMQREFAEEFGWREPPPTPEAIRHIREQLSLQAHYKGKAVACFTNPDGSLAVLAEGQPEIGALFEGLSEEEEVKVVIMDTM